MRTLPWLPNHPEGLSNTPVEEQLAPSGGWHTAGRPRVEPLTINTLPVSARCILWLGRKLGRRQLGWERLPDVFLLLLHHPRLFWPWLRFASRLMPHGTLHRQDTELVILRVAWNCRCRYEWGQHVAIGLREGLAAVDIARVVRGPDAPGWSETQSALLAATDELHENRIISQSTWKRLAGQFQDKQLLEISMLVGLYETLAGVLNTVGLGLEPEAEAELAAAPIHGRPTV